MKPAFILRETKEGITLNFRQSDGKWMLRPTVFSDRSSAMEAIDVIRAERPLDEPPIVVSPVYQFFIANEQDRVICRSKPYRSVKTTIAAFLEFCRQAADAEVKVYK